MTETKRMTDEEVGRAIIADTNFLPSLGDIRRIGAAARRLMRESDLQDTPEGADIERMASQCTRIARKTRSETSESEIDDLLVSCAEMLRRLVAERNVGVVTCKECRHFRPERDLGGSCERWKYGYGIDRRHLPSNEVVVECDEGWGMDAGPDFGCVLGERIPHGQSTTQTSPPLTNEN